MKIYFKLILIILIIFGYNLIGYSEVLQSNIKDSSKSIKEAASNLDKFRQEYSLIFVYTSKCPYCHKFASILHKFASNKNIKVNSLTDDGGMIPPFNDAVHDKSRINELGVDGFPVLFVEHNSTKKNKLIADGLISYNELDDRITELCDQLYNS